MPQLISFKVTMPIGGFSFEYRNGLMMIITALEGEKEALQYFTEEFTTSDTSITQEKGNTYVTFLIKERPTLSELIAFIEKHQFPALGFALGADGHIYCLDAEERGKKLDPEDSRMAYVKKNQLY